MLNNIENIQKERIMMYPKIRFTVEIDVPCLRDAYLKVKSIIRDDSSCILGYTTTRSTSSFSTKITFNEVFEVTHYIGIDENQSIVVDIMDNDVLKIRQGYLYSSVQIKLKDLHISYFKVPILRNDIQLLGYITLHSSIDLKPESIHLNNDSNKNKLSFFRSTLPNWDKIKQLNPRFTIEQTIFTFDFDLHEICPLPLANISKSSYFYIQLCLKNTNQPSYSNNLKLLWKSSIIDISPYSLNATSVKIDYMQFIKNKDVKYDIKSTSLVFQVFAGNYDMRTELPTCCSYFKVNANTLLSQLSELKNILDLDNSSSSNILSDINNSLMNLIDMTSATSHSASAIFQSSDVLSTKGSYHMKEYIFESDKFYFKLNKKFDVRLIINEHEVSAKQVTVSAGQSMKIASLNLGLGLPGNDAYLSSDNRQKKLDSLLDRVSGVSGSSDNLKKMEKGASNDLKKASKAKKKHGKHLNHRAEIIIDSSDSDESKLEDAGSESMYDLLSQHQDTQSMPVKAKSERLSINSSSFMKYLKDNDDENRYRKPRKCGYVKFKCHKEVTMRDVSYGDSKYDAEFDKLVETLSNQ